MIIRNLTNLLFTAVAATAFALLPSGSISAQQYSNSGCTSCGSSTQTVNFNSGFSSSTPQMASTVTYASPNVVSQPSYPTTNLSYPVATYATGVVGQFSGSVTQPIGTVTSMQPRYYAAPVNTQPVYYSSPQPTPVRSALSAGYRVASNGVGNVSSGLAQMKAQRAANGGIRGHIGGGLGGARYEGVGWSSQSAQDAIQHCCYWGQRPTAQIGVSRGADGLWYACVLYN